MEFTFYHLRFDLWAIGNKLKNFKLINDYVSNSHFKKTGQFQMPRLKREKVRG